jgi:AraC family transcriptional regulator, regulatory protein of adaptative response / methylated-DNA-[protein]-cysteine methyltransferase
MNTQIITDYDRIASAINYIQANFRQQPSLETVAQHVHLSPFHFQKMFTDWAGVSPKKFLQYLSIEHAKSILNNKGTSLFDAAFETGLSGTGRLHDLFISIEGMTPGEYRDAGRDLAIKYSFANTPFGQVIVASTPKGICYLAFCEDENAGLEALKQIFTNASVVNDNDKHQENALTFFSKVRHNGEPLTLHLKGTPFQIKVWEALLRIPMGKLKTYSQIAAAIDHRKASRAVGSAIGDNPVAFLIPCHRVIRSTGEFGNYHWGATRKTAIIGWEACSAE